MNPDTVEYVVRVIGPVVFLLVGVYIGAYLGRKP